MVGRFSVERLIRPAAFLAIVITAFYVMAYGLICAQLFTDMPQNSIQRMLDGTAHRPFVYRTLLPAVTNGIVEITPQAMQDGVSSAVQSIKDSEWLANLKLVQATYFTYYDITTIETYILAKPEWIYPMTVTVALMFASLLGYAWMLYRLATRVFPQSQTIPLLAPLLGLLILPTHMAVHFKLYDFPTLFLGTACLYAIFRLKWRLYCALFALACLNHESASLLIIPAVMWASLFLTRSKQMVMLLVQVAIFTVVKTQVNAWYAGNDGIDMYFSYGKQLLFFIGGWTYLDLLYGLSLCLLIFMHWEQKPRFLRLALWMYPAALAAFLLNGQPLEYRVMFEVFPVLALLGAHTIMTLLQWDRVQLIPVDTKNEDSDGK